MTLQLYQYQVDCINHAREKNTIVKLPTGRGKTLIAARLIEHFLAKDPAKKIGFLVPTRPLVEQQSGYCTKHCRVAGSPAIVQKLVGNDQDGWGKMEWAQAMRKCHIFLGTAALFQKAFVTEKHFDISCFSLLVFDECHNAVGNSPMASVMRDCVAPFYQSSGSMMTPRVLGLTASFINGSMKNLEKKRMKVEALLQSTIICPDISSNSNVLEKFKHVHWRRTEDIDKYKEAIETHVEKAIDAIAPVKDVRKLLNGCIHVFEELGLSALEFYIEVTIVQACIAKASQLQELGDQYAARIAERLNNGLPRLRDQLDDLAVALKAYFAAQNQYSPSRNQIGKVVSVPQRISQTLKLKKLIEILDRDFAARDQGYRGIVFVEQVALVSPLAQQLNEAFTGSNIHCGAVAGTGHQNDSERQELLGKFQQGKIRVLVATATLEEGIDVSRCEFVVRLTHVATTKAHIQGAGRARHEDAVCYYFENNPQAEQQKEADMEAMARNHSLSLNALEFQTAALSMSARDVRHPYPYSRRENATGQVNVFNCKQIFNQYCSIMLGRSITPKVDLYEYSSRIPGQRKQLAKVRYPTPKGWQCVIENDYLSFWNGVDMDKVFPEDRVKNKSTSDKEEMAFVYIATVQLRENGYLDSRNAPDSSLRFEARRSCPLGCDNSGAIRFKNVVTQSMRTSP